MNTGEEILVHRIAHIQHQGLQAFRALLLAAQVGSIGIEGRSIEEDHLCRIDDFLQGHGGRRDLALKSRRALDAFQITHQFLAGFHQMLGGIAHHATIGNQSREGVALADVVIQPQLDAVITLRTLHRIEEEQIADMVAEVPCRLVELATMLQGTRAEGEQQDVTRIVPGSLRFFQLFGAKHRTHGFLRCLGLAGHRALRAQKDIAGSLGRSHAVGDTTQLIGFDRAAERAARLIFRAMGLVDDPIADRREQASLGRNIAEEHGLVGHYDIRALRPLAGAMDEALAPEERALPAQTVMAARADLVSRQGTVIDLQPVDIVIVALLDEGKQARQCRSLAHFHIVHHAHLRPLVHKALDVAQAGVVGKALQAAETQALVLLREQGKLVIHQLVEQGIGLRGHADGDLVAHGEHHRGNQVGHRFANPGTSLDRKVHRRLEGRGDFARHLALRFARFEIVVDGTHHPVGCESCGNLFRTGKIERFHRVGGDLVRVDAGTRHL